jgi:DNA-binding NtrC family response regulator
MGLRHGQPPHFHLLWEEDLDELREMLESVRDRHAEVVSRWYELYVSHFGDRRRLSESEFRHIFEPALLSEQEALLRKDMDGYTASVLRTGERLAERHVPLEEAIVTTQLSMQAAHGIFPQVPAATTAVCVKFDKLSSIQIILLVGVYARLPWASAATRIDALELAARPLPPDERTRFRGLVGHSPVMHDLYQRLEAAGRGGEPLLILGERGVGKESVARAIHRCGSRPEGAFAAFKCGALPHFLVESELFGYKSERPDENRAVYLGLYRAAQGGTLFLDEITDMPLDGQRKLLGAIDETGFDGGADQVRIIASTSRNPPDALRMGQFDPELGPRFQNNLLRVAPLRERIGDIPLLAAHFIDLLSTRMARRTAVTGIDDAALEAMERYSWPGNIQELFETIESAFARGRSAVIGLADLPSHISGLNGPIGPLPTISFATFADAERGVLKRALEITDGNKVQAAKLLKISRKKLYSGIAKYGLKHPTP